MMAALINALETSSTRRFMVLAFGIGLALRLLVIAVTPRVNYFNTDLEIYRQDGRLVVSGVNPYNPEDGVALRRALREQSISPTLRITGDLSLSPQQWWDYQLSGNPPLTLLFFGAIQSLAPHPLGFRIAFAIMDSLAAAVIVFLTVRYWPAGSRLERFVSGLALGAVSLVTLQWGVHSPQDKGVELLLMVATLAALWSGRRHAWLAAAPCLLGLSVAYKLFGVLLVPYCLVTLFDRHRASNRDLAVFLAVAAASAIVWYLPYAPHSFTVLRARLAADLVPIPSHASPLYWLGPRAETLAAHLQLTHRAQMFRLVAIPILSGVVLYGMWTRKVTASIATAALLAGFMALVLIGGSLDRMNIAFVPAIVLLGREHVWARRLAIGWYVALGLVSVSLGFRLSLWEERYEAMVVGVGAILFFFWILVRVIRKDVPAIPERPAPAPVQ